MTDDEGGAKKSFNKTIQSQPIHAYVIRVIELFFSQLMDQNIFFKFFTNSPTVRWRRWRQQKKNNHSHTQILKHIHIHTFSRTHPHIRIVSNTHTLRMETKRNSNRHQLIRLICGIFNFIVKRNVERVKHSWLSVRCLTDIDTVTIDCLCVDTAATALFYPNVRIQTRYAPSQPM